MIWDPRSAPAAETPSPLVSHLTAELAELCGGPAAGQMADWAELAKAVERYLREQGADGEAVEGPYLLLLAAQALSSLGQSAVARRLYLLGSGLVRPAAWEASGGRALWVVDLPALTVREDASLELAFFGGLRLILDELCEVWDATRGRGVLGLRQAGAAAEALLGPKAGRQAVAGWVAELRALCRRRLAQAAVERGWEETPEVWNLDFERGRRR